MRRLLLWSVFVGLTGCLNEPTLATMTPNYGYYDANGCVEVLLSGHDLGEDATATIGGNPIIDLTPASEDESLPDYARDVGFDYTGFVPASSGTGGEWADVEMEVDGETLVLEDGFYYRTCPNGMQEDANFKPYVPGYDYYYTPEPRDYTVDPTGDIEIHGCGLDASTATVVYTDVATNTETATVPLTQICEFSSATADIPDDLPPGDYIVELVKGGLRERLRPYRCGVPEAVTFYGYIYTYYYTPADCQFDITIAGAR